jgi:hypothetical protein
MRDSYPNERPVSSLGERLGWFALGFLMGVTFVMVLGLYLTPAKGRVWIDPPGQGQP